MMMNDPQSPAADEITEERITFPRGNLALSGVLAYPAAREPGRLILLCAPHPNFAGNMENNVITALARALARRAVTLRFDYHGIGASEIDLPPGVSVFDYWLELEESHDYAPAVADASAAAHFLSTMDARLEMDIVGYSFGSATGLLYGLTDPRVRRLVGIAPPLARVDFGFLAGAPKPCLLLCGGRDFVCAETDFLNLAQAGGALVQAEILPGEDHFFRGSEALLVRKVAQFLNLPDLECGGLTPLS